MKAKTPIYMVLLPVLLLMLNLNCKKEAIKTAPTVSISAATNVTATSATAGGDITADGGAEITAKGICWSTNQNPTTSDSKTSNGSGSGSFTVSLTGLTPGATYNIRAYAINSVGTGYSSQTTFTTPALAPVLTTTDLSAITATTVTSGGNITNDGGSPVTARGVCWSKSQNPTTADAKTTDGIGTGSFTSAITGLTPGTAYYFRAYATNSIGTAYGNQITATTTATLSTLTTTMVSAITSTMATSGGNIASDGGAPITARGVCWSASSNPTILNSKTTEGSGTGSFTSSITGLTPGATYYVKAYATNSIGTAYGNELTLTAAAISPVLTTGSISNITATSAVSGGNITTDGGSPVTARGVCWSTSSNPTTANSKTTDGIGTGSFTSSITGLTASTTYYVRAYATNSIGTGYGSEISFTTQQISGSTITDIDGNVYSTVTIGTQVWMASNLKTTKFNDGTNIPNVTDNAAWSMLATPGYCWYNNDAATNKNLYGALYNWFTVNTGKLCPIGWHVPSDAERTILTNYLGGVSVSGGKLKESGTSHWLSPNIGATNETSFTALPGGYRVGGGGQFYGIGSFGYWWTSSENSSTDVWNWYMYYNYNAVDRINYPKPGGFSVRCVSGELTLLTLPTLSTTSISNIASSSAVSGGTITSDGGTPIVARGVCWSISPNPNTSNSKTTNGVGIGSFTTSVTGLSPNTTYYVRAYATNSAGTAYGLDVSFVTTSVQVQLPTITTTVASSVTTTSATSGGSISSDGGSSVIARGVCWSTSQNPTIAGSKTTDGTGTGNFTSAITGLAPNTTYYVRSYAINSVGTSYGSSATFTTSVQIQLPTLTTTDATANTTTSASSGGNISSDGGAPVIARGVCWSTSQNPTIAGSKTTDGTGAGSFTSAITGLAPNTTYYVRSYAINSVGTAYGSQATFITSVQIQLPTLTTADATAITTTSASSGGNISTDGGAPVIARGVCWSTNSNPTISDSKTTDGTGTGSFTSSITGLSPNTTYYIRAYATNSFLVGISYGSQVSFTTSVQTQLPTLTTTAASAISTTSATSGGSISSDGGATITARGVCWSETSNPTVSNSKTTDGIGTGSFASSLTGLIANNTYYVRAYATNSVGTSYGSQISFTTSVQTQLPTITTTAASAISTTSATSGGSISSGGGATVTARGVCWSTSTSPTITNSKTNDGTGTESFTSSITGLSPGTTYYVRAYAINSIGTAYGNEVSFSTIATLPILTTTAISSITSTTASSGGNITSDGGALITARGVCWSTSSNPTVTNSKTSDGTGTGSFTSTITGLAAGAGYTYHVRSYATNSVGTAYGNDVSFSPTVILPTLTTMAVSSYSPYTASSGGNLLSWGGGAIIAKGVCWSTSPNPTISNNKTNDGTIIGSFTSQVTELTPGITYYLRAYATNSAGTAYGNNITFVTMSSSAGTVTDVDGNVYNTVTIGTQVWMASNLKTTKFNDGTAVPLVTDDAAWNKLRTPGYCWYNNDAANKNTYGALYNWFTVNATKLCPTGFHIPSDFEWKTLANFLGGVGVTGGRLKEAGTSHWNSDNGINDTGFTALPGGWRSLDSYFEAIRIAGYWWSSTAVISRFVIDRDQIFYDSSEWEQTGFSVRCIRD